MPAACAAKHSRGPQLCRAYLWLHLPGPRGDAAYSTPDPLHHSIHSPSPRTAI